MTSQNGTEKIIPQKVISGKGILKNLEKHLDIISVIVYHSSTNFLFGDENKKWNKINFMILHAML